MEPMNIFATHSDPRISALWLDDLRANKMILESCQLLSTAINVIDPDHNLKLYKNFNPNHPCGVWTRATRQNFNWLLAHTLYLLSLRGKPEHKSYVTYHKVNEWFAGNFWKLPSDGVLTFQNSAANESVGINYKNVKDVHLAYRLYLNHRWKEDKKPPTWKTGVKPNWCDL
jgi:hypothetical protein